MPDLRFGTAAPTETERVAVDQAVAGLGPVIVEVSERLVYGGRQRTRERRHLLLPALHALQRAAGWISPGGLDHVCRVLEVPPAEAYGVATFYHLMAGEPPEAEMVLHVCDDVACRLTGGAELVNSLTAAGYTARPSPCLGQCERGPAVLIQRIGATDLTVV